MKCWFFTHDWSNWELLIETPGYQFRTCKACGRTKVISVF